MHTNTHTAFRHPSALHRVLAAVLLVGMSWQQVHLNSIAFALTPDAALLQVEVEVSSEESSSSSSSVLSATGGIVPVFSASLITADSIESQETSSGATVETGSTLIPETEPDTPDFSDVHHAAPQEIPVSSSIVDTPENTHPTFEVEKQAEIQSAEELEQRLIVTLVSPSGKELDAEVTITEEQGQYVLTLEPPANFEPGKYHIEATLDDQRGTTRALQRLFRVIFQNEEGQQILFEQDFTWGVLAFNPDHSSFLPGEMAAISMGVLDDAGRTLCDAPVTLTVVDPAGSSHVLSTQNGEVTINPDCRDKSVTYVPDYSTTFSFSDTGEYTFTMQATTRNGVRSMSEIISVVPSRLLDVYRSSATRIYPLADYEMKISVTPSHSFVGSVTETVPNVLTITKTNPPAAFIEPDEETGLTTITWGDRLWEAGTVYDLRYEYDAPDISPEFYLAGPVRADGTIMRPLDPPVQAEEPVISLLDEQTMTGIILHGSAETEEDSGISPFFSDVQPSGSVVPGFEDVTAGTSTGTNILSSSSESSSASGETIESSSSASGSITIDSSSGSLSSADTSSSELSSESSSSEESPPSVEVPAEPDVHSGFLSWIALFFAEQSFAEEGYDALHYEEPRQWQIASDAVSSITGKVYAENGTTLLGAGRVVGVSLSGSALVGTGSTDAGGQYTITGVNLEEGQVISLYLDNQTEKAVTVTLGSGTTMTGMNLRQNYLTIRNDSRFVTQLTTSHIKVAATNDDADILALVDGTDSGMWMPSGRSMIIRAGTTFQSTGYTRVGSGIVIDGSFKMGTGPVNLSGSWITQGAGSFTGSNTVIFDGANASNAQFITSSTSTFSGVTVLGNNGKTATLLSPLRLSGSLRLAGATTFTTNAHAIRVRGSVTINNSGLNGASVWTVGGNWRIPNAYSGFAQGTAVVLTGSGQIFDGGGMNYGNVTVQRVATISGSVNISDTPSTTLTINTGALLRILPTGVGLSFYSSQLKVLQNGTLSGGQLQIHSGASIPVQRGRILTNTMSISGGFNGNNARIAPAKYESTYVTFAASTVDEASVLRLGTGTTTFQTSDNTAFLSAFTGSHLTLDTLTYNATLVLTGNVQFYSFGNATISCNCGTNPIVFSGSTNQQVQLGDMSLRNIAVNKTAGAVTITESGTGQNVTLSGGTLNVLQGETFRITRTLLVNGGTTMSAETGASILMVGDSADVIVRQNGLVTGSGVLNIGSGASISTMSGTIRSYSLSVGGNHTGAGNRIAAGKYDSAGTVLYTTDNTTSFEFSAGTTTFNGSLYFSSTGGTLSIRNDVTNPNLMIKGTMTTCPGFPACRGKINWQKGTGVLTFTGGFIHTLQMSGASLENITMAKTNGYLTLVGTGSTSSMTLTRGEFRQSPNSLWDINGALTISRTSPTVFGQYSMSGGTLTLSGNLINTNGIFRATTGSVVLDGGNQTLSGSNTFYNLRKAVTTQKTLTLATGKTQSVSGTLILQGITGSLLLVRSTVAGQQSYLNLEQNSGAQTIDHVNVQDNYATGQILSCFAGNVYGEGCMDFGNNRDWNFGVINLAAKTVLGSAILPGKTASYSVNGGPVIDSGVTNSASGVVLLSGSILHQNDVITVYLDGNTEKGVHVYVSSGTSFFALVYQDSLLMTSYSGGIVTNTALDTADNNGDTDISSIYSVVGGELRVKAGKYTGIIDGLYKPGGAMRLGGALYIQAPFDMQSNPVTLSGAWLNIDGSFSGTNTVTFDQSAVAPGIQSNGSHFYNLVSSVATGTTVVLLDPLSISGSLTTMSGSGIFDANYKGIRVNGNVTLRGSTHYLRGAWSVDGNWDSTDTPYLVGTGSTVQMNGSGTTMLMRHLSVFDNITVNGSVSVPFETSSDQNVLYGTLLVSSGKTLTVESGLLVVASNAGDLQVRSGGRIQGSGSIVINSGSSISVMSGTIQTTALGIYDQHVGAGNRIAAARYDTDYIFFKNNSGGALTPTQEFSPGTTTFSGTVFFVGTAGPLHINMASTNAHLVFLGSLLLDDDELSFHPLTWTWGAAPLVFSGSNLQILDLSGAIIQNVEVNKSSNYLVLTSSGGVRNFVIDRGNFTQNGMPLTVSGSINIYNGGLYYMGGGTLSLHNDLMNLGGTFQDTSGTVRLLGTYNKLRGDNTFYNLTKIASSSGQYINLEFDKTQTVNGTLTLQGTSSGEVLSIYSTSTGSNAMMNLTSAGSQIIDHVDVLRITASGQQLVCYTATEGCIDSGSNVNWLFAPAVASSSSSSASNQDPGGRRDDSIDRIIEEVTGTAANVLLTRPPDPPPGCTLKLMEFRLGGMQYFLTFEQNVLTTDDGPNAVTDTVDIPVTPGHYISGVFYAGIHEHRNSFRALNARGEAMGYYTFDYARDGGNLARMVEYANDSVRSVRWTAGSPSSLYHWTAAYMCPLTLHSAPGDLPPGQELPGGDFTVPEFPVIDPIQIDRPIDQSPIPGLNPDDFIIDDEGNIISVDGKFLIDRDGNILRYDDLIRSVTGSLLLRQMRSLHFASLLEQGGLTLFYKPLTAEQLELLRKLLKRPLVSVVESDFLPNTILEPLIEEVMRNPTEENWQALMDALTPDVVEKGTAEPTPISIISDAISRSFRELASFLRTAGRQISDYVLGFVGLGSEEPEIPGTTPAQQYESKLRPAGSTSELAVFHLRFVTSYGKPLSHVPVVLFSVPKFTTTDNDGVATFFDVPAGIHRLEAHLDDGRIETRMVTIRPPTNVRLTEPVDTVLPLADVVVPEPNDLRTDPDLFPPLALLLLAMVLGGNVSLQIRRHRKKKSDEEPPSDTSSAASTPPPTPGISTIPPL